MMINLGVGVNNVSAPKQSAGETQNEDEAGTVENGGEDLLDKVERHINSAEGPDGTLVGNAPTSNEDVQMQEDQEDSPDITVLNTIIEEMYDRFKDAEINDILQICGEVLGGTDSQDEVSVQNG